MAHDSANIWSKQELERLRIQHDAKVREVLTKEMVDKINFPSQIEVELPPLKYTPMIRGTNVLPLEVIEDWMAKLNFKDLKRTLVKESMFGGVSNSQGLNPIPALVSGEELLDLQQKLIREGR